MKIVIALVLLVVGSLVFHWWSPWWFTPLASNWGAIDTTINITLWITGFVFVAVNLFLALAVFRYRSTAGRRADYEPENASLEKWLTGITTVGIVAMLAPGLVVWADFVKVPEDADVVEVFGEQWQWSYRFPGADGQLGEVDARFMSAENPFGMSPNDPAGTFWSAEKTCGCRWTGRSRCCCAPATCCTISRSPSSGSRWTWCPAPSVTSGSPPPAPAASM